MNHPPDRTPLAAKSKRRPAILPVLAVLGLLVCGCSVFSSSFVNLFDSGDGDSFATLPNAPGHVVVAVINRTQISEQLLSYLGGKLPEISDAELRALRPRIRMRVRVTYIDGTFQTIEFIGGSRNLIDPEFDAEAFADLNQNDLGNSVVLCDVASVAIEPGTNIEVFVPVALRSFALVELSGTGGQIDREFQPRERLVPQFRALQLDEVDEDGNVTLLRNIGVRDAPSPTPNVICGSVVSIVVDGVLSVPFTIEEQTSDPSFDVADEPTIAGIGGRYEFIVSVQ